MCLKARKFLAKIKTAFGVIDNQFFKFYSSNH